MVGKLLSLYVRAGVGVANLAIRTAARGGDLAVGALRIVLSPAEKVHSASGDGARSQADIASEPPPPPASARPLATVHDEAPLTPVDETAAAAKTVDDEPELVGEFADAGAEDGANAQVEIEEPWNGYAGMTADEVIARIGDATTAELAVIELYERAHKQRQTVLAAAERRNRALANAPS